MHLRRLPAAVLLPALGLALTACTAPGPAAPAPLPTAPGPGPATTAAAAPAVEPVVEPGGAAGAGPAARAPPPAQRAPHPAPPPPPGPAPGCAGVVEPVAASDRHGSGRCTADDLRATVTARPGERATEEVELTNRSAAPCTMTGYPTVELLGDSGGWLLPHATAAAPARTVTLPPGGTARVVIDYLPRGTGGRPGFDVTGIALTPPGGTAPLVFHWEGASPRAGDGAAVRPVAP
ncbi:DUF4232 domain-containing protein [Kitasatospora phosalacinea]|uniref:DUF4232 domain-containing protein n=1 Tax=Kitasatospora phosalacinea TaxID=2065 RepID=UPI003661492C